MPDFADMLKYLRDLRVCKSCLFFCLFQREQGLEQTWDWYQATFFQLICMILLFRSPNVVLTWFPPGLKQKLLPTMSIADTLGNDHRSFRNLAHGHDEKRSHSQFFQSVCNHLRWSQCLWFCVFTFQQYLEKLGPDHLRSSWDYDNLVMLIILMMGGLGGMRIR